MRCILSVLPRKEVEIINNEHVAKMLEAQALENDLELLPFLVLWILSAGSGRMANSHKCSGAMFTWRGKRVRGHRPRNGIQDSPDASRLN